MGSTGVFAQPPGDCDLCPSGWMEWLERHRDVSPPREGSDNQLGTFDRLFCTFTPMSEMRLMKLKALPGCSAGDSPPSPTSNNAQKHLVFEKQRFVGSLEDAIDEQQQQQQQKKKRDAVETSDALQNTRELLQGQECLEQEAQKGLQGAHPESVRSAADSLEKREEEEEEEGMRSSVSEQEAEALSEAAGGRSPGGQQLESSEDGRDAVASSSVQLEVVGQGCGCLELSRDEGASESASGPRVDGGRDGDGDPGGGIEAAGPAVTAEKELGGAGGGPAFRRGGVKRGREKGADAPTFHQGGGTRVSR